MSNDEFNVIVDNEGDVENTWNLEAMEDYRKRQEEKKIVEEETKKQKTPQDFFLREKKRTYKSLFVHSYKIKGKQLSYSSIENVFDVEVLQEDMQYIDFCIRITSNNILFGLQFIPDCFKDLFLKLADIKNKVSFRISKHSYKIVDLLNYDELRKKWRDIKNEIDRNGDFKQIKAEELQQIIEAGNQEYLTDKKVILNEMQKMFVYKIFFRSFMHFTGNTTMLHHSLNSNIAPEVEVPLALTLTKEDKNNLLLCYTLDGKNADFNESKIKKVFRTQFNILKESYDDYLYNFFSVNEINAYSNWLINVNCSAKEIVNNGSLIAEIICDIEDITDKVEQKEA